MAWVAENWSSASQQCWEMTARLLLADSLCSRAGDAAIGTTKWLAEGWRGGGGSTQHGSVRLHAIDATTRTTLASRRAFAFDC